MSSGKERKYLEYRTEYTVRAESTWRSKSSYSKPSAGARIAQPILETYSHSSWRCTFGRSFQPCIPLRVVHKDEG